MKMYCCELENTKDGSSNFAPENILNRQLIFTRFLTPYQKRKYRWIGFWLEDNMSEDEIVRKFLDKFPEKISKINWEKIKDEKGNTWDAWVIHE